MQYYSKFSVFYEINERSHGFYGVFIVCAIKIEQSTILSVILDISALKYISIHNFTKIRDYKKKKLPKSLTPILLNLCIFKYFDVDITNFIVKIEAYLIFVVKTNKTR